MTIQRQDGPLVVVGAQAALGSTTGMTGVAGPPPYVSGTNENPDAGPSVFFAGVMLRDMRLRTQPDGHELVAGGYPNQDFGYISGGMMTLDIAPSAIATANLAALQASTSGTGLTLVSTTGAGITVLSSAFTVPGFGTVIPVGTLQIDAAPSYTSFGTSGAIQGWAMAACGRVLSLTSAANLSAITYTVRGFDLYGMAQTEAITGPNANTVSGKKGWKWVSSVTPNGTSASTVSVGTADIFEFPLRADRFFQVDIWWNNAGITSSTGFTAADTTSPATTTTGSVRGTYAVQTTASDGTRRLQIVQRVPPSLIASVAGVFGVTPV